MDSLSAVVASSCTQQPSSPAATSRPQAAAVRGSTKWRGSSAQNRALPALLTAAIAKMMEATGSVLPSERMHSLAAAEKAACGGEATVGRGLGN